ncbi:rod shape-determining protein MreC [Candidatus Nomurabacteria bacterium]|nr:rod shape-determining protein MreC [Candidatus Nomurabacteria bacterium]
MIRYFRFFLFLSALLILVILLHKLGAFRQLENSLTFFTSRAPGALYQAHIADEHLQNEFSSVSELEVAYKNLKAGHKDYQTLEARFRILEEENLSLRQQLGFIQKNKLQSVGANVVGRNIDPVGNTIVLDRGSRDGVQIDSPIIVEGGVFVGKVMRVYEQTSVVRLVVDNQSKVAATVLNQDRSIGIVEGGLGISLQMNLIPQNEEISVGDTVVTSGLEANIPRGLILGIVQATEKEPYKPFQKAIVTPSVDVNRLGAVSVLLSKI